MPTALPLAHARHVPCRPNALFRCASLPAISVGTDFSMDIFNSHGIEARLVITKTQVYSQRSVTIGSTRAARRAGIQLAVSTTNKRVPSTAEYVLGSVGVMPQSTEAMARPQARDPAAVSRESNGRTASRFGVSARFDFGI